MQWAEYLIKGVNIPETTTNVINESSQQIVINIEDNGAACKAAMETHLKTSEQEWSMLLEVCLKFQLRQKSPTAGLNNLQTNLSRILEKENVLRDESVIVSLLEGSLYYLRAVLVNSEAFIGYPMEMLESAISRMATTLLEMKSKYLA
mmetsp:Transcript_8437/g.14320  ORF Transcript_8437/g.14320 Transcript_8437/m.14320 type:complete len:148 (+) Transcript_8437:214-657(+)